MESAFQIVAEPNRRAILTLLLSSQQSVGEIERQLRMTQPAVSKHLRVLREAGLVTVRRDGRRMLYRTNAEGLRPLHEWTTHFEKYWRKQLERIKERAERN
jgi:DNA-binding transcriptional ArsR family regulator